MTRLRAGAIIVGAINRRPLPVTRCQVMRPAKSGCRDREMDGRVQGRRKKCGVEPPTPRVTFGRMQSARQNPFLNRSGEEGMKQSAPITPLDRFAPSTPVNGTRARKGSRICTRRKITLASRIGRSKNRFLRLQKSKTSKIDSIRQLAKNRPCRYYLCK